MSSAVKRVANASLPTRHGDFRMYVYNHSENGEAAKEHVALVAGEPDTGTPVLVRIHSECFTGDIFGSQRCDCGEQLDYSLKFLQEHGSGVLLYLRQEGRGIGLTRKIHAYELQEQGMDTVEANVALGLPEDARDYRVAAEILMDLNVGRALLLTNNPAKISGLKKNGIEVIDRLPVQIPPNPVNANYLEAKREKMGHLLPAYPIEAVERLEEDYE